MVYTKCFHKFYTYLQYIYYSFLKHRTFIYFLNSIVVLYWSMLNLPCYVSSYIYEREKTHT